MSESMCVGTISQLYFTALKHDMTTTIPAERVVLYILQQRGRNVPGADATKKSNSGRKGRGESL